MVLHVLKIPVENCWTGGKKQQGSTEVIFGETVPKQIKICTVTNLTNKYL